MTASTPSVYTSASVLLLSHYATTAMQDFLTLYLNDHKVKRLTVVNFPLPEIPLLKQIEVHEYVLGKKISVRYIPTYVGKPALTYITHFFQSFWIIFWLCVQPYNLVISQNSLLALVSIFFRTFGRIKRVVFYSHGISQKRFAQSKMNSIYRLLDRFVYIVSDANWALSKNIQVSRSVIAQKPIRVVPANVPIVLFTKKRRSISTPTMVFIGTLNDMNGADKLPEILRDVHKVVPTFRLDIIGVGPQMDTIKQKIRDFSLEKYIRMLGYQDMFTYASTLSSYFCGLAPYRSDSASLLGSTDPMKIQIYAAAGIPTIVTEGYTFSKRIHDLGLGLATKEASGSVAKGIIDIYTHNKKYQNMCEQSRLYAQKNDIYKIYEREFASLL